MRQELARAGVIVALITVAATARSQSFCNPAQVQRGYALRRTPVSRSVPPTAAQLVQWARQLGDPSSTIAVAAARRLGAAGAVAVPAVLPILGDVDPGLRPGKPSRRFAAERAAERANLREDGENTPPSPSQRGSIR
jgi:hypothetical protein